MRSRTYGPEPVGISRAFAAEITAESVMAQQASFAVEQVPYNRYEDLGVLAARSPCGRLTLTSGDPVASEVNNSSTVYYTPYLGSFAPIFDTVAFGQYYFSELSLALDANTGHTQYHAKETLFDFFLYIDANGAVAIGSGPAWSSASARGTGAGTTEIVSLAGVYVNANDIQLRVGTGSGDLVTVPAFCATLVGTVLMNQNDGSTSDTASYRGVSNAYNRILKGLGVLASNGANYNYSAAAWRPMSNVLSQASADAAFSVKGEAVWLVAMHSARNSTTAQRLAQVGIGVDSTTVDSATGTLGFVVTNACFFPLQAFYNRQPPNIGKIKFTALERSSGATETRTWLGSQLFGLQGTIWS